MKIIKYTHASMPKSKRRLLLAAAALSPLIALNANSTECVHCFHDFDNVSFKPLHSIEEALRIPAIAALFDEKSQAILQLDYADFETVVSPYRTSAGSRMWALSVDLQADSDPSGKYAQSFHSALDLLLLYIAPQHQLLNILTVFSCDSSTSVVSLVRKYQTLLMNAMQPTGLYGFGVVADERACSPRMTMLCVTQPIS